MKRLLTILILLTVCFFAKAQNPIPADSAFPIKQSIANALNTIGVGNVFQGKGGLVLGVFADTTAANRTRIKFYPGAMIFTQLDTSMWVRNTPANKWLRGSGSVDISSINFYTDSSLIICFGNGVCDTIAMYNFDSTVINIVQNFTDSSVYNINDSTILICHGVGNARVCDTIHLGNSNTYYFIGGDTVVTCDTIQIICPLPDSCYQQQVCDTIVLGQPVIAPIYQNGLWKSSNIIEFGDLGGGQASLLHNTELNAYAYNLLIKGQSVGLEPLSIQLNQIPDLNTSLQSWLHSDGYQNTVRIRMNYTNPFYADTIGYMYDRIGYPLMTNSTGSNYHYELDNIYAKQVGILFHTLDTAYTDAVTIFGNQVPATYCLTCNPQTDTTLYDSRIAIFKTDKNVQFPGYPNTRNDGVANKAIIPLDTDGNLGVGSVIASTSIVEIISDTSFRVCDLNGVCDTFIVDITNPTVINIFNDTTIIICNEAGSCDTITVNNFTITNGQVINVGNTLFVSKAGNDATGQRQRVDLHFLTIRAALAAAFTGDVIVVFPGTYEENAPINLAKSVNYHFIGKGELRLNTSSSGALFTDSATVSYSKIWGEHWTFTGRNNQRVLNQTAASSVEFVADSIVSGSGRTINTSGNARTTVRAKYMYANATLGGNLWIAGAYFYGDIDVIQVDEFGQAVWLSNVPSFTLHSKRIFSQNTNNAEYLIHISDCNPTDSIYIHADEIYAQREWAFWAEGESKNVYLTANRISDSSDCVVISTLVNSGMLYVEADVIETRTTGTIDGIIHSEGGSMTARGAKLRRPNSTSGADVLTSVHGGSNGQMYLNSVDYDKTKVVEVVPGAVKRIDSLYIGSNFQFTNARLETDTAIIVAANNLTLGRGNVQIMSGNTTVNAITTAGWQAGSASVFIIFSGTPTVKNNTAGGAGTATILLAGSTDFVAAAGDVLEILYDGTNWREASRTLAASAGGLLFARTDALNMSGGSLYFDNDNEVFEIDNVLVMQFRSTEFSVNNLTGGAQRLDISPTETRLYSFDNDGIVTIDNDKIQLLHTSGKIELSSNISGNSAGININTSATGEMVLTADGLMSLSTNDSLYLEGLAFSANTRRKVLTIDTITHTVAWGTDAGITGITADNGLTASTATNVQLGGTLIKNTTISSATASFRLTISGVNTFAEGAMVDVITSGSVGTALRGETTNGRGLFATETAGGIGVYGSSTGGGYGLFGLASSTGVPIYGQSVDGVIAELHVQPTSTNTVVTAITSSRETSGTGADGIGQSWDFYNGTSTVSELANQIISKFPTATHATRTSQLLFTGVTGAATETWLTIGQSGYVKFRPMTVTEAGAISTAEGLTVFVSNTNGTFTSIGLWIFQNGAWHAL